MDQLQLSCKTKTKSKSTCVQVTVTSSFRDWTWLYPEFLDIIVTKLHQLSDYIRFCGICPQWRTVALENNIFGHKQIFDLLKLSRKKLPMLMIKTEEHNDDTRALYCVLKGVTYNLQLPIPYKGRFFGSSHGWLMYYHESMTVTLFNPLNHSCISLPIFESLSTLCNPSYYLVKGILSTDPTLSPNNFTVAVIFDLWLFKLAVYKSGDEGWKFIDLPLPDYSALSDIVFHEGYLYGVTIYNELIQIDTGTRTVKTIIPIHDHVKVNYLVESRGDLLLVQRSWLIEKENYNTDDTDLFELYIYRSKTVSFKVFKLALEKDSRE